jgi:glycosyltransferase involved in cell wall biosynthesis
MQLIVPAFNEEARLPGTLTALRAFLLSAQESAGPVEVIVVDNGSTDATARLARAASSVAMPVQVIACETKGKGAAVRAGVAHSTAEVVGFMDADCATDLAALVDGMRLLSAGADVAIASRAVEGSVTTERHSRARALGARLYRRCTREVAPGIADTQCGFKLFRGELARQVFAETRSHGFSFDVEVLGRAQRRGARIVEFPAHWDDVPGSTFLPFWHGAATFWELAVIAHRLRATPRVVEVPQRPAEPATTPALTLLPAVEG